MRTLLTKRTTKEIVKDWDEQMRMKQRLQCEEDETERMYAYLCAQDAANKVPYSIFIFNENTQKKFNSHCRYFHFLTYWQLFIKSQLQLKQCMELGRPKKSEFTLVVPIANNEISGGHIQLRDPLWILVASQN